MDNGKDSDEPDEWSPFEHQVAGHTYEENHGKLILSAV